MTHRLLRRSFLALLGSAGIASATPVPPTGTIYVIGNSFVRRHDVGQILGQLITRAGSLNTVLTRVRDNAWLADHLENGAIIGDLRDLQPRWVVLQDHSLAALTPEGRERSTKAVRGILKQTSACPIFLTPWARLEGHALYSRPGMPAGPEEMLARTDAHYDALATEFNGYVAPVASGWHNLTSSGFRLHAEDGYHANRAGAWFVAMILAASFGMDPRWGAPVELAGLSNLAKLHVLYAAECDQPVRSTVGS